MKVTTAADRSALIRLASTMPVGSPERRAILAGMTRAASALEDLAFRALRSGQVVGTPAVSGYRVAPEGIVVDLTGVSVVLPPSKEVADAVFSGAAPAEVSRLVSMLPALAPFAPAPPASKLPAAQFKAKAKAMVQRGLDAYSSEDLMALVEGQKKEVPEGAEYDNLVEAVCEHVARVSGNWAPRCDEESTIGEMVYELRLSVSRGAVTASGKMELVSKDPFKATRPLRTYGGSFSDEYKTVEDLRKVLPAETLRGVKLYPDPADHGFGIEYHAIYTPPNIPTLDLGGAKMEWVAVVDPYKVTIPLRSLSRKALEELVRALAA